MGWKIYGFLMVVLLVPTWFLILSGSPAVVDYVDVPVSVVAWLGFFSFAYRRPLFTARFWQVWFVVIVLWDIVYNLYFHLHLGIGQQLGEWDSGSVYDALLTILLLVPLYAALYRYGFRSPEIWRVNEV